MVQTVDSAKLADSLNTAWEKQKVGEQEKLHVLMQINTSAEEGKCFR
jgi:uncharacterized pyridoxal phosphate-containing UPF0001 family protein